MLREDAMNAGSQRSDLPGFESSIVGEGDWYTRGKRVVDLVIAGLLLIPALPLMLAAMALVRLTSRGPAIYTQIRVGLGGRTFVIYKIRTMRNDCEKLTGPRWADRGRDPRVTRIGNFLRKTHLDELPQLFNVFRGDMTLVGPRPERPEFVAQLEQAIPCYRSRLEIRPGVTGLAQILLPPDIDFHSVRTKLMYDLFYLQDMGFWIDLKIIACTGLKVLHVPPHISRILLGVSRQQLIEGAYEDLIRDHHHRVERSDVERVPVEVQPAY